MCSNSITAGDYSDFSNKEHPTVLQISDYMRAINLRSAWRGQQNGAAVSYLRKEWSGRKKWIRILFSKEDEKGLSTSQNGDSRRKYV